MTSSSSNDRRLASLFAGVLGAYSFVGGCAALIGWASDIPRLTNWNGDGIAMFVNTAIMAACAGAALVLRTLDRQPATRVTLMLGLFVIILGGATLFQHIFDVNLGIDTLLVRKPWGMRAAMAPGRPGPPASISFTLLGLALMLSTGRWRARGLVAAIGIGVSAIATLALIGYAFDVDPLFASARLTGIAMQTATIILALALGLIAIVPEHQPMRALCENSAAGLLARRALPFVIALPILLGWLRLRGQQAGLYDLKMGTGLLVFALIVLLCALLWWCVAIIAEREKTLRLREASLRQEIEYRERTEAILARRAHEQSAHYKFVDRLHRAVSLPEVFAAALDGFLNALRCDRVAIRLFDDTGVMRFAAWRGLSEEYRTAVEGHSLWNSDDTDAQPICIQDIDASELPVPLRSVVKAEGIRAVAFIPLIASGKIIGKFAAYYNAPHNFTGEELNSAIATARQLEFGLERKRAETQLRDAAQKAEAASLAKDNFLAALSHELRTPLTPALLMATALEQDSALSADVHEQLATIRRNIKLEARLIDDLLDITRVSHGKLKIESVVVSLHELLRQAQETIQPDLNSKQISMRLLPEARESHVMADPARLQQVFSNLLRNAVKFTPAHGSVTVRSFNPALGRVAVCVEDTGIGIPPEALAGIFHAFDQGGLEGRQEFGGLGLGLSISKAIIELHGGELRAASDGRGKGAAFTVELNTTLAPVIPAPADFTASSLTAPLRVLVVEDHEPTLAAISRLLERDGHRVFRASTVNEALAQAAVNECDLVISDLGLPDGTGFELMKEIRLRHGWPGIALSGYGMETDLRTSAEFGFAAHLVKPVDFSQLRAAMETTLASAG
jgi:signal transduction histidine kinase